MWSIETNTIITVRCTQHDVAKQRMQYLSDCTYYVAMLVVITLNNKNCLFQNIVRYWYWKLVHSDYKLIQKFVNTTNGSTINM